MITKLYVVEVKILVHKTLVSSSPLEPVVFLSKKRAAEWYKKWCAEQRCEVLPHKIVTFRRV